MAEKAITKNAKEIWAALQALQDAIAPVAKDGDNPHFNSKYATLENVIESLREPCKKVKIGYQQWADGLDIHTRVFMLANPDDFIEQVLEMVLDANPQRMGSAITYYRRYSLGLVFNLRFADDDGNAAAGLENKPQQRPNLNRAASAAPRNNPAPAPQKKKIMGEFNFNEMMKEINACQHSADMKNIVLKWAGAFELSDEQRASANDARQRRYGYLKKINR